MPVNFPLMDASENLKKQKLEDGCGPVHHRVYSVSIPATIDQTRMAMRALQADPNAFSPQLLAKFEKTKGEPGRLKAGDEFLIRITGPWDGPVRVAETAADRFKLVTLEGHLEAGEILFEIKPDGPHKTFFVIESIARSRDKVVDFVYDKVPIAKIAQTEMWDQFCKAFAEKACDHAEDVGEVEMLVERRNEETGEWEKL